MDDTSPQLPIDVSAVIDADWPEWRSDLRAHFKVDAASIADAARKLTAS